MTQTELQKEIEKLMKKANSISRKAYNGDGKFNATLFYYFDRINKLKVQLNNI